MPRYSNGARVLGDITLYAQLKSIDAKPPKIPTSIKSMHSTEKAMSTPDASSQDEHAWPSGIKHPVLQLDIEREKNFQ